MPIIDFLPDPTFAINTGGNVIAWNQAMEELTGIKKTAIMGKGNYEYAIPFYGERRPILVDLVLMPGEEVERQYDMVKRDGDTLMVEIFIPTFGPEGSHLWAKASPMRDDAGKITGAIETIRDITVRKQAEQEMAEARLRLAEIIDFLPDATMVIDTTGVVIAWNRAMEELTGVDKKAMIGKGNYEYAVPFYGERRPILVDLVLMPGDQLGSQYRTVQREGDTLVVDTFIPEFRPGGVYLWAKASPLYDPSGKVTGSIETIRDITDRIRAEERLARSKAELEIAAEIQQSFLPETLPSITSFDVAARCEMAKEVGGDFFDVMPLEVIPMQDSTFGLLIADVSGKGVPAALFMALSRIVIRVNAARYSDPALVIRDANNIISQSSNAGMFVTLFYGILSEKDRTVTYVNAGHNPPMFYRAKDQSIEELMPTGIFVGVAEDQDYTSRTVNLKDDDMLVLFTDGITESNNAEGEMFEKQRLKSLIMNHRELPAEGILEKILEAVNDFAGNQPQFDDITLMVIKGTT